MVTKKILVLEDDECNLSFESLPPGWIETKDSASGKIYYYNEITEEFILQEREHSLEIIKRFLTNVIKNYNEKMEDLDFKIKSLQERVIK